MSEDVSAIKTAIEDIKEKLSKIESKRGSIRDSVYQKVKQDYQTRLDELNGQLAGKKELLKENLREISEKKQPLKSKLDVLQEQLEEIELRHSIGEYSDAQYESMSGEIKEKMSEIEGDLESIKKEEKETKELLGEGELDIEEETEDFEEETEEREVSEKEELYEEPLPEVSDENMIAEELFSGNEKTAEESESVISNASAVEEENKALRKVKKEGSKGKEQLFDLSQEEEGKEGDSLEGTKEEEDWLSSLEQELNEEAEEGKKSDKVVSAEKKDVEEKSDKKEEQEGLYSICPKCNYKNRPDAWYCENCGAELTSTE